MIRDPKAKDDIAEQWAAVRKLCQAGRSAFGGFITETTLDEYYNLPFVLAYAVLDQVLDELIRQNVFGCPGGERAPLGTKMDASKAGLTWKDYSRVEKGKEARNDLAHRAQLTSKQECLDYIDAVEAELEQWEVL